MPTHDFLVPELKALRPEPDEGTPIPLVGTNTFTLLGKTIHQTSATRGKIANVQPIYTYTTES